MSLFTTLRVTGSDAKTFLQGQLTCDINMLSPSKPLLAACNSAQGRVQAILTVEEDSEGIRLQVVDEMAERTFQRLRKYVLRSKVALDIANNTHAIDEFPLGQKIDADNPLLSQIRAGIPHVFAETHEAFVAQMLNLDTLGAISFEKGCYTGQEIIARMHFRGAVKRRMFRFEANCPPPLPGTRLLVGADHAGDVVYAAESDRGCELLAVVNLVHADTPLTISNIECVLNRLTLPYGP